LTKERRQALSLAKHREEGEGRSTELLKVSGKGLSTNITVKTKKRRAEDGPTSKSGPGRKGSKKTLIKTCQERGLEECEKKDPHKGKADRGRRRVEWEASEDGEKEST